MTDSSATAAVSGAVTAGLSGLVTASWGPLAGQVLLITLGALGGAFWAVSGRTPEEGAMPRWVAVLRLVTVSAIFTSTASLLLQKFLNLPYTDSLLVCAFMLAAFGDTWPGWAQKFVQRFFDKSN